MTDEIDEFERSTRRSRRIKLGLLGVLCASPIAWALWKNLSAHHEIAKHEEEYRKSQQLSESEVVALRATLAKAHGTLAAAEKAFVADVTPAAISAARPGETRCAARMSAPTIGAGESYTKYGSIDGNYFGDMTYSITTRGQPVRSGLASARGTVDEVGGRFDRGEATKNDLEDLQRIASDPDDALFVVGEQVPPLVVADGYTPGRVVGAAYLYSFRERRIVCMADLFVEGSPGLTIEYTYDMNNYADKDRRMRDAAMGTLNRDLDVQVRHAIAEHLRATVAP